MLQKIRPFPYPSSPRTWETGTHCNGLKNSLLPHYFNPRGDKLNHEQIISELMSAINNEDKWYRDIGLQISVYTPFWAIGRDIKQQTFVVKSPSRYEDLFNAADENHDFWGFLASCNNYEVKVILEIICPPYLRF